MIEKRLQQRWLCIKHFHKHFTSKCGSVKEEKTIMPQNVILKSVTARLMDHDIMTACKTEHYRYIILKMKGKLFSKNKSHWTQIACQYCFVCGDCLVRCHDSFAMVTFVEARNITIHMKASWNFIAGNCLLWSFAKHNRPTLISSCL